MEKAVIITRTDGLLDYAKDNETVSFVEPFDVEDVRTKIVYLLEHSEEARRLGHNVRKCVDTYGKLGLLFARHRGVARIRGPAQA